MPRGRWCEAPAAAVRGGPGARQCIGTRSHHPPSRHGWRAARGRPAGAASAAARLSDAPAWTRRWAAEAPVSLVAVRGAAQPAPTYYSISAAALLSPAAAPPELTGVPPLRRRARRAPAVGATCLGGGRAVGRSACGAGALSSPRKVAPSPGLLGRPVPGACLYVAGAPAPTRAERDLLALAPLEAGGLSSRRCASEEDALIGSRHTSRVRLSALACHSFRSGSRLSQIRS